MYSVSKQSKLKKKKFYIVYILQNVKMVQIE